MPITIEGLKALGLTAEQIIAVLEIQRKDWQERKRNSRARSHVTVTGQSRDIGIEIERTLPTVERSLSKKETISARVEQFDRFWSAYPKRKGSNPKQPARKAFDRALKRVGLDTLVVAAEAYAKAEMQLNHIDTPYICQAVTWLNQARADKRR